MFVDLLLPLHIPATYTYRVPRDLEASVAVGVRVVVQFGNSGSRLYSALVRRIHDQAPPYRCKYILSVLDLAPIVDEHQFSFWEWLARYYMCYPGDVMSVALPGAFKLASETTVAINPQWSGDLSALSKQQMQVVTLLSSHPTMRLADIATAVGQQKILPLVKTMVENEVILLTEELRDTYRPRTIPYVVLAEDYRDEEALKLLFDDLERHRRTAQSDILMRYLQLSHFHYDAIPRRDLPQGSPLTTLIKNGILLVEQRDPLTIQNTAPTSDPQPPTTQSLPTLSDEQQQALDTIRSSSRPTLLHGVTSSGKTEVYICLIHHILATTPAGSQALLLLPEIALTEHLIQRLRRYFGTTIGVYHSRLASSQRIEVWRRTAAPPASRYRLLLGARSALFLPFQDLRLVIVDEEHDASYKQQDPAPRYHARDAALLLASQWHAATLLGSATPSLESILNAATGKYTLATLKHRYAGMPLPTLHIVDLRQAYRDHHMHGHFSQQLLDAITQTLAVGKQCIIFQNRRGFAPHLVCDDCHHIPQCIHCDVSLVYHKSTATLRCHYCGYSIPVPEQCPACHSSHLKMAGAGTERIEEDLQILFPDARIARLDLDSANNKNTHFQTVDDFANRRIDILVGTQMVTKGLDFQHVALVAIPAADSIINYPDFRAVERAYQVIQQVAGRAGRHASGAQVIIQTFNPAQLPLSYLHTPSSESDLRTPISESDLTSLLLRERQMFRYPPYHRLITITLRHRSPETLNSAADSLAAQLRTLFGPRVVGPEYPLVTRIRGLYLKTIMLRFEKSEPIAAAKPLIMQAGDDLKKQQGMTALSIHYDVDPV